MKTPANSSKPFLLLQICMILLVTVFVLTPSRTEAHPPTLDPYPFDFGESGEHPVPPKFKASILKSELNSDAIIRMAYLVPANRSSQKDAVQSFQNVMILTRDWYRDQMKAHGYDDCSINLELEADGETPKIHVVNVSVTDEYLRGDIWSRTIRAAQDSGLSIWSDGEIWVLIPEAHTQSSDGSFSGGVALGASFGSGTDPGVAMIGSNGLARFKYLANNRKYDGLILPELGPYPLVQNISFPWFEGETLSSVASSITGALMHELGHALGLPHDARNDANFQGNLMYNGLRGVRGNFYPGSFASDQTWLSYASAQALATSRYLGGTATENNKPAVNIATSGEVAPANGLLTISFSAADNSDLFAAHLIFNGIRVGEKPLTGTSFSGAFVTPYYDPLTPGTFKVIVFDKHGNRGEASSAIAPTSVGNRAPKAHFRTMQTVLLPGESVLLDAGSSSDPDSDEVLMYQWDLDGDGIFDTVKSTSSSYVLTLGNAQIISPRVRVTDQFDAFSDSTPLVIQAHRPQTKILLSSGGGIELKWSSRLGIEYGPRGSEHLGYEDTVIFNSLDGNGGMLNFSDFEALPQRRFYYLNLSRKTIP